MKYIRPQTLEELLQYLGSTEQEACVLLAGGTDLMPRYERGVPMPAELVDMKHVPELTGIYLQDGTLEIGALTTVEELKQSEVIRDRFPALAQAADEFASIQIRHRATIGGNITNASPAGDLIPPLAAMNASLTVAGGEKEQTVPIGEFALGPGKTVLKRGEVLKSVVVPVNGSRSSFVKLGLRRAMAIAVVNVAASGEADASGFKSLSVAVGAVAPTVVTLDAYARAVLEDPHAIDSEIDLVDEAISPIDDLRATANYRRKALKNLVKYTLHQLLEGSSE